MGRSRRPVARAVLLLLPCLAAVPALSDERAPDTLGYNLPEIVVRSSPILVPSPNIVREADTEDFDALNAHTIGDVLVHTTGMSIQRGTTGDANVLVRGFRHRDVLFLLDGIPIASVFEGTIDLDEIGVDNVAKIKMIKGAPSVIYGTNAMAGVIDIIPKSGLHPRSREAAIEIGEDSRLSFRGSYGGGGAPLEYFVSTSYADIDGYSLSDDYTAARSEDGGLRTNSDFKRRNAFLHLRTQSRAIGSSSLIVSVSDNERGYPPQAGIEEPDFERLIESNRLTIGLANDFAFMPVSLRLHYNGYQSTLETYSDSLYSEVDERDEGRDHAYGATVYSRLATSRDNLLILSTAYEQDRYENDSDPELVQDFRADTYTVAIEDEIALKERWRVSAGGLFSRFEQPRNGMGLSALNAQLVVGYHASSRIALHASAARRTRFPKLRELYRDRYGNPELDQQRANNFEAGIRHSSASGLQSDVTLFLNELDGLIDRADRRSPYENLDDVTFRGIEAASGGWIAARFFGRVGYTLVDADEVLEDGSVRQLRRIPRHSVSGEVRYRLPMNVEVALNSIFVSQLYDLDADEMHTRVPDYLLLGSKTSISFGNGISAYVAASNLTDKDYANRLGFPLEGRSVRFGSAVRF